MEAGIRFLQDVGAVLVRQKKHYVWRLPNGITVAVPKTPSDHRADKNLVSEIRHKMKLVDSAPKLEAGQRRERKERREQSPHRYLVMPLRYPRVPPARSRGNSPTPLIVLGCLQ